MRASDLSNNTIHNLPQSRETIPLKGTVQRKLRGVLSGINRKLMIWAWAAWG
jgi:hypothetical protein